MQGYFPFLSRKKQCADSAEAGADSASGQPRRKDLGNMQEVGALS